MAKLYTAGRVDFNKTIGKINKELHGSNSAPILSSRRYQNYDDEFLKLNFQSTRTHDWALWNNGQRMVDTHFVFPLLHLDATDPKNYVFGPTDAMIKQALDCNMKIFYRLGTSIEHTSSTKQNHFNTLVPEDFDKYAEACAGIVRHYTRGWANGFEYKEQMQYWEIWNEPDLGAPCWAGTQEEFYRLFITIFKRLKSEFPELKIGGPAITRPDGARIKPFLMACKEAGVKPDFFSWHSYSGEAESLIQQPIGMREFVDELGFTEMELCINEWHYMASWDGVQGGDVTPEQKINALNRSTGITSACFNLAVLTGWQDQPLDSAFYYGSSYVGGSFSFRDTNMRENKCSFGMKMFGNLIAEVSNRVATENIQRKKTVYLLGGLADDGTGGRLLVTDYCGNDVTIDLEINGMEHAKRVSAFMMDEKNDRTPAQVLWDGHNLTLIKNGPGCVAFYVTFE